MGGCNNGTVSGEADTEAARLLGVACRRVAERMADGRSRTVAGELYAVLELGGELAAEDEGGPDHIKRVVQEFSHALLQAWRRGRGEVCAPFVPWWFECRGDPAGR
ncbi:MAG: hypothetical protein D6806_06355 [Deltaproteobacteria bacterium]|nr:MAG: hypothetical protein D6806_06355 [Deltaproteobacteria bacterium]